MNPIDSLINSNSATNVVQTNNLAGFLTNFLTILGSGSGTFSNTIG